MTEDLDEWLAVFILPPLEAYLDELGGDLKLRLNYRLFFFIFTKGVFYDSFKKSRVRPASKKLKIMFDGFCPTLWTKVWFEVVYYDIIDYLH